MLALKIAVFLLTLSLGIIAPALAPIVGRENRVVEFETLDHTCHPTAGDLPDSCREEPEDHSSSSGTGSAFCNGTSRGPLETALPGDTVKPSEPKPERLREARVTSPLNITYKAKAQYTEEARSNGLQGTVTLSVTFLASGGIGGITTVRGLPFGLTEQAINSARKIRFEPEEVNGVPRTTTRPVTFTFNIY